MRTPEEKAEGIKFLKSLGLDDETIEAIEESIDHHERMIAVDDWREFIKQSKE